MAALQVLRFAGRVPKLGNSSEECEDDFCSAGSQFALADGATGGCYSQVWAHILVRAFCAAKTVDWQPDQFFSWLEGCRAEWSEWERELAQKELPWFTREKLLLGSFSTFVGISITKTSWRAFACGDSCLFVIRHDTLHDAFPIRQSEAFDNTPALLSTSSLPHRIDDLQVREGEILPGDRLYLTSDALASWFLADCERGEKPWAILEGIASGEHLDIFVAEQRQNKTLKNDDVTLLSLEILDEG